MADEAKKERQPSPAAQKAAVEAARDLDDLREALARVQDPTVQHALRLLCKLARVPL